MHAWESNQKIESVHLSEAMEALNYLPWRECVGLRWLLPSNVLGEGNEWKHMSISTVHHWLRRTSEGIS
jgi:hypothetical protein